MLVEAETKLILPVNVSVTTVARLLSGPLLETFREKVIGCPGTAKELPVVWLMARSELPLAPVQRPLLPAL